MAAKRKSVERIKDVLIAVLFASAILLLSFFWKDISLEDLGSLALNFQEEETYSPEISELVCPEKEVVNFGSDSYTVLEGSQPIDEVLSEPVSPVSDFAEDDQNTDEMSLYTWTKSMMQAYLKQTDLVSEQIEKAQFDEVMSYPSVYADFGYTIPFKNYLENNSIAAQGENDDVSGMSMVAFSTASSENMFIYNSENDEYYRFVTGDEDFADRMAEYLSDIINSIENSGAPMYYTISSLVGVDNETLIPLSPDSSARTLKCTEEFKISDSSAVNRMEQLFFPSGLDFVRKITENKGSLLYNYGYNEKVLTLDESGSIFYTETIDSSQYSDTDFYSGLELAVEYVKNHGGWTALADDRMTPYLKDARPAESENGKYRGYSYTFGVKADGIPLSYTGEDILSAVVYGKQVTDYRRDIVRISDDQKSGDDTELMSVIDIITGDYSEMNSLLGKKESGGTGADAASSEAAMDAADSADTVEGRTDFAGTDGSESQQSQGDSSQSSQTSINEFESFTTKINCIEFQYLRDISGSPGTLIPAWHLRVDDTDFWCSAADGSLLYSGEVTS